MKRIIEGIPYPLVKHLVDQLLNEGTPYEKSIKFALSLYLINFVLMTKYLVSQTSYDTKISNNENLDNNWEESIGNFSSMNKSVYERSKKLITTSKIIYPEIQKFKNKKSLNRLFYTHHNCNLLEPIYANKNNWTASIILSLLLKLFSTISLNKSKTSRILKKFKFQNSSLLSELFFILPLENIKVMPPWLFYLVRLVIRLVSKNSVLSRKKVYQNAYTRQFCYIFYELDLLKIGSHGGQSDSSLWTIDSLWCSSLNIPWAPFNLASHAYKCTQNNRRERMALILYCHDGIDIRMRSGMESKQFRQYKLDIKQLIDFLLEKNFEIDLCAYPGKDNSWLSKLVKPGVYMSKYSDCSQNNFKIATYPSSVFLHEIDPFAKIKLYYFRLSHWPRNWSKNDLFDFKGRLFAENLHELQHLIQSKVKFCDATHFRFCGLKIN